METRTLNTRTNSASAARARPMLAAAGVTPSKARGQNFLVQTGVADRIVACAALEPDDHVFEIGPGLGLLSERIAAYRVARITLFEIDPRLAARLEARFAGDRRIRVVCDDFLDARVSDLLRPAPLKVVGNLPFNSAAAILRRLCGEARKIDRMVLMFQREVGERIRACPGEEGYGALSVFTQLYFEIGEHFRVSAGNFYPRPRVDAEVLVMAPWRLSRFSAAEEPALLRAVRAAFSAPRKTLRNAVGHALGMSAEAATQALEAAGIAPDARAHTLSIDRLLKLARTLDADQDSRDA